jgi:hypothetical protein
MITDYRALCAELTEKLQEHTCLYEGHESKLVARARAALAQPEPVATEGRWSEGVCGDGAAILRDGVMIPIEEVVQALNRTPAEPVAPTDEAWQEFIEQVQRAQHVAIREGESPRFDLVECALALWREAIPPAPEPVAPTDAASRVAHYLEQRRLIRGLDPEVINALHAGTDELRQAALTVSDLENLARWGTPAAQPVPVSERLPGPEDCDAEGRCWWWHPAHIEDDFDNDWALLNHEWAGLVLRDSDDSLIYSHWLPYWALPVPAPTNTINQEDYDRG